MTDLETFESLRPFVEPLSKPDRVRLRLELFGSEAPSESADASSETAAVHYDLDRGLVRRDTRTTPGGRGPLSVAAACLIAVGIAAVWFTVGNRDAADQAPAQQPSSTPAESRPAAQEIDAPVWYDTIRPLLPDGFDQIVLTDATPEVVGFKAFRTGTRQLLDVTITLQPGDDIKDTGEAVTFSDEHGIYIESVGSVALTTPDERQVVIRCGLRPIGGGSVEPGGLLDADRDSCDDDGVDNLDIDPISRRSLAAKLADEFPTDAVTPAFGHADTSPETTAVNQIVNDFAGDDRPFGTMQADGVVRLANLSPTLGEPATTELTVINGIWPPNGDGSAFDDTYANSPQGRFSGYGDIAAALVVVDGTGYHIATTDLSDTNLTALGELLQQLIAASPDMTSPVAATAPSSSTPGTATTDETTASQPTAPETTQVLDPATALAADEWLTVPPDATGLEWQYAVDGDSGYASRGTRSDRIVYGTAMDPKLLIIHIHNPPLDPGIESGLWAGYPPLDGWTETRQLGDTEITVQGAESVDPAIADMLIATPEQMLATEPLGVRGRATPIATAMHNGRDWTVLVERSGRYQMTYVEMRPSSNREADSSEPETRMTTGPEPIPRGAELTVDYQPSAFAEGMPPGEVLAIGRAPSNVSSVNVEFSDGTVVTAATAPAIPDTSNRYWVAIISLAGDSKDVSVANVTVAGIEGR